MSAAACAKIIIDNYGAASSAGEAFAVANEAACESLMMLIESNVVSWSEIKPITDRACEQAETIDKWRHEMLYEIRMLAEMAIEKEPAVKEPVNENEEASEEFRLGD